MRRSQSPEAGKPMTVEPSLAVANGLALDIRNLSCGILQHVSLLIESGRIVCLSGPSGSGKSRLLRAIADLDPHEGEVRLGSHDQLATPAHCWRQWVMLVPAESQWWADTVGEHFLEPSPEGLEALGFTREVLDWQVSRLSSGEKQRLALLRAVSHEPRALLLDEPTANLDGETGRRMEGWVRELVRTEGIPVLWVAHDPDQIRRVADHHYRIAGERLEAVT